MSFQALPPFGSLEAFVAVAQRRSLKAAAPELNLSVSALCRRIQTLEAHLGAPVFERANREFRLTPEGERLLQSVCVCFDSLKDSIAAIRPSDRRSALRIGVLPGLAGYWLAPRLQGFQASQPFSEISIETANLSLNRLGAGLHAMIVLTEDDQQGRDRYLVRRLAPLRLRAVCSPGLARRGGRAMTLPGLAGHTILMQRDYAERLDLWLEGVGWTGPRPQRIEYFDSAALLLAAAAGGLGVAILSDLLADPLIQGGRLADPFGAAVGTGLSYSLVARRAEAGEAPVRRFQAWLEAAFDAPPEPAAGLQPYDGDFRAVG